MGNVKMMNETGLFYPLCSRKGQKNVSFDTKKSFTGQACSSKPMRPWFL